MAEPQRISTPSGRTHLPTGSKIGGYSLVYLDSGGMSVVYRGLRDDHDYILKEVPAHQPLEVLALNQEKALLERLNHPGIVEFIGLFEESGYYYLVMEFIEGRALEQVLKEGQSLSEAQVRNWALQLCEILEYLHRQSPPIIFRDLKPSNVMLQNDDRIRLIDFGIARLHKEGRQTDTTAMGSFLTASPEHYGGAQTDARSDVYTLGATIYELLASDKRGVGLPSYLPPLRSIRPEISPELEAAVSKSLAMEPQDRFQSVTEMRLALQGESADKPVVATQPAPQNPPKAPPRTPGRIRKALLFLVGALTLTGLLVGGALSWKARQHHQQFEDCGFEGDVFAYHQADNGTYLITLGEDIALFRVTEALQTSAADRAKEVCKRLNGLYHEQCPTCGHMKLESEGFRIARYLDESSGVNEVVFFYAHEDNGELRPPLLLAVLDEKQAKELGSTPRFAAGYWRNLTRDLVEISRGRVSKLSPLGMELQPELDGSRHKMGEGARVSNLKSVLQEMNSEKAMRLRELFLKVPSGFRVDTDNFTPRSNFYPLKG